MAMEKKRTSIWKIFYLVYEEATISRGQVFVNAKLFQNGNLDSADERQQVFAYQWTESDFNYSSVHENLSKLKTEGNPPNTSARLSEECYHYRQ